MGYPNPVAGIRNDVVVDFGVSRIVNANSSRISQQRSRAIVVADGHVIADISSIKVCPIDDDAMPIRGGSIDIFNPVTVD